MSYNFEKIIKNIEKSKDYLIITKSDTFLIVGIKLNLTQIFITGEKNFMSAPNEHKVRRQLGVFFLIKNTTKASDIEKTFIRNDLPVLDLIEYKKTYQHLKEKEEDVTEILDKFIKEKFKSYKEHEVIRPF